MYKFPSDEILYFLVLIDFSRFSRKNLDLSEILEKSRKVPQLISIFQKRVISCADLANLNEFKRRALLNTVTDEQYEDVVNVLMMMPRLEVETEIEGTILHNFTN
jgi:hypothetical protein